VPSVPPFSVRVMSVPAHIVEEGLTVMDVDAEDVVISEIETVKQLVVLQVPSSLT
jgi:hypothetical protein